MFKVAHCIYVPGLPSDVLVSKAHSPIASKAQVACDGGTDCSLDDKAASASAVWPSQGSIAVSAPGLRSGPRVRAGSLRGTSKHGMFFRSVSQHRGESARAKAGTRDAVLQGSNECLVIIPR